MHSIHCLFLPCCVSLYICSVFTTAFDYSVLDFKVNSPTKLGVARPSEGRATSCNVRDLQQTLFGFMHNTDNVLVLCWMYFNKGIGHLKPPNISVYKCAHSLQPCNHCVWGGWLLCSKKFLCPANFSYLATWAYLFMLYWILCFILGLQASYAASAIGYMTGR